jgi:hypothetical protein
MSRFRNACWLLDEQALKSKFGLDFDEPLHRVADIGEVLSCERRSVDKRLAISALIVRGDLPFPPALVRERYLRAMNEQMGSSRTLQELAGLGDRAYWDNVQLQLTIFLGRDSFSLSATGELAAQPRIQDKLIELASGIIVRSGYHPVQITGVGPNGPGAPK